MLPWINHSVSVLGGACTLKVVHVLLTLNYFSLSLSLSRSLSFSVSFQPASARKEPRAATVTARTDVKLLRLSGDLRHVRACQTIGDFRKHVFTWASGAHGDLSNYLGL